VTVLPARASLSRKGRFVPLSGWRGVGHELKVLLRERLRSHPLYSMPVKTSPPVEGRTDAGVPIPINTLGRWLWGVPGYAGNAVFEPEGPEGLPGVWLPPEAPPEAEILIRAGDIRAEDR